MNNLKYKGYEAAVEFDAEDKILVGRVIAIQDVIGFHGESITELELRFHELIDHYLATCLKLGQEPNHPSQGYLGLHLPPDLHSRVEQTAKQHNISVDAWATQVLSQAVAA